MPDPKARTSKVATSKKKKQPRRDVPGDRIDSDVRDLIHMMMKLRELEIQLLATYLRLGDYKAAEKKVLGEVPTFLRMALPNQDPGHCPPGFHEENGLCVPD